MCVCIHKILHIYIVLLPTTMGCINTHIFLCKHAYLKLILNRQVTTFTPNNKFVDTHKDYCTQTHTQNLHELAYYSLPNHLTTKKAPNV